MSSELTALRWQLIRTIEADQLLEQENIELRAKLIEADEKLSKVTSIHREACAKIAIGMGKSVALLKNVISDTRSEYFAEMGLMKKGFMQVVGNLNQISLKNKDLIEKVEALTHANTRLQSDLERSCAHSDKKTGHLADELSRLKKELIDSCSQHTHALSIIDAKDQALRTKDAEIDELQKQLKASQQNIGKLSRTIKQLEMHGNSEIEELKRANLDAEAAFNEKINAMDMEIVNLKSEIESLKSEISRLSVKQAPKKTPFTQYVDLKNQNEDLKAKVVDLKNIVRSVDPKRKSKVSHLVGMTAVDSVDNMLANNAKSRPTSPRSNDFRLAPPPPSHVPEVSQPHPLDAVSSGFVDMSAPTLTPHPPAHALSATNMINIQQSRQAKPTIKLPSQKASGQRPSQYRTGSRSQAANEKVLRSSTSEKPARPQSGGVSRKTRAPSPIVMT